MTPTPEATTRRHKYPHEYSGWSVEHDSPRWTSDRLAAATESLMAVPSDALSACPFCGSKAEITVWQDGATMAHCSNAGDCWATIGPLHPNDSTKREARRLKAMVTDQWNRRPANTPISGGIPSAASTVRE